MSGMLDRVGQPAQVITARDSESPHAIPNDANFPTSCPIWSDSGDEPSCGSGTILMGVRAMSTGRVSDELVMGAQDSRARPAFAWKRSIHGLNLTLAALRARIALLALTGCSALLLRAVDLSQWKRALFVTAGAAGIAIGVTALVGLSRHVGYPRGHA